MSRLSDHPTHRPVLCLLALVGMAHLWLLGWRPVKPPPAVRALPPRAIAVHLVAPKPSPIPFAPPAVVPAAPGPHRAPHSASPQTTAAEPPAAGVTPSPQVPELLRYLPASVVLDLQWQQGPATRPAQLRWQLDPDGFALSLETTPPSRTASWLRSQGSLQAHGLAPARHTVRQAPASERALTFIRDGAEVVVAFSAHTYTRPALVDVQDALSWLPQWLARLAAGQGGQPIVVADVAGRVQPWQFVPDVADPWHWQTTPLPDQTGVELWLSPQAPHWPRRMIVTPPWGAAWVVWRSVPQAGAPQE